MKAPLPNNETARLEALCQYNILDTLPEEAFDDLTALAGQICETPIALITLIDQHRLWVKSKLGLTLTQTSRDHSFCAYAILDKNVFVIQDALADERFANNPLVTDEPHIQFYAGVPLIDSEGYALGTLCVLDFRPRELSPKQIKTLQTLSRQVIIHLELRKTSAQLAQATQESQQLEQKLYSRERELLDFLEHGTSSLHCVDANGIILWANQAELDLLGYTRNEYVGRPIAEFHADKAVIDDILQRLTKNETLKNYEAKLRCKDGSLRHVLINSNVAWKNGKFSHTRCFTCDITEYKQAQEERNSLKVTLQHFFDLSLDLLCVAGMDGYFKRLNSACEKTLGYRNLELLRQPFLDFVHPDDQAATIAEVEKLRVGTPTIYFENRYRCTDGSYKWLAWTAFPNVEEGLIYCIGRDITDRKQVQELLEIRVQQQAVIAALGQRALAGTDLSALMDEATRLVAQSLDVEYCKVLELLPDRNTLLLRSGVGWNPGLVGRATVGTNIDSQAGYTLIVNQPVIVENLTTETRFNGPAFLLNHGVVSGLSVVIPGSNRPFGVLGVHTRKNRTFRQENIHFLQTVANVLATAMERQQVQEELQRQNRRSQLFTEITLKIRQSLQLEEILQTTVTEVQNILQVDRVLLYRVWPDGTGRTVTEAVQPGWPAILGMSFKEEVFPVEYQELYRQGQVRAIADVEQAYAEVTPCLLEFLQPWGVKAKLVVPILVAGDWGLGTQQEEKGMWRHRDAGNSSINLTPSPRLWGLLIAHHCTSPRQWTSFETELLQQLSEQIGLALTQAQLLERETRQRLELARSNAELQEFASVASHDLQEPLRKIRAFGDRLMVKYSEVLTDQGRDYLTRMQNAAERMQGLIDDLLTLSRVTTRAQPFVSTNMVQVVQDVLSDLEVSIQQTGGQIEVGQLPTLEADPIQMRQLMQNLISNALKFRRTEKPPIIRIYSQQRLAQEWRPNEGINKVVACQIFVEDNGIGFDEKYLDRIFNAFQRLHGRSEYEGTGMGLAICRKIVERHNGSITAQSIPIMGTTFIVTLPLQQRQGDTAT